MTDPRFDPAFQRGYSGPDPELVLRPAPATSEQADRDAGARPAPVEPAPTELSSAGAPRAVAPVPPRHLGTEPATDPVARRSPFRLALLILGPVLLAAAGGILYQQVLHPNAAQPTAQSQFLNLLVYDLPPALAVAGFASLILWLALGALDHASGSDADPDPTSEGDD